MRSGSADARFASTDAANRFLVERILDAARRAGTPFSEIDEHQLRTPGCGHTEEEDEAFEATIPQDWSAWDVRTAAARALRAAFRSPELDEETRAGFREACDRLRGSVYLLSNLTLADAWVLDGTGRLGMGSVLEFATVTIWSPSGRNAAPPVAAARPTVVAGIAVAAVALGLALLVLILVR